MVYLIRVGDTTIYIHYCIMIFVVDYINKPVLNNCYFEYNWEILLGYLVIFVAYSCFIYNYVETGLISILSSIKIFQLFENFY